jgi:hypothetical protein
MLIIIGYQDDQKDVLDESAPRVHLLLRGAASAPHRKEKEN